MSARYATLYPVVLIAANTVAAVGVYALTGPPTALLLGVVALLLVVAVLNRSTSRTAGGDRRRDEPRH